MSTLDDQFLTPTTENRPSLATLGGALVLRLLLILALGIITPLALRLSSPGTTDSETGYYGNATVIVVDVITILVVGMLLRREGLRIRDILNFRASDIGWGLLLTPIVFIGFFMFTYIGNLIAYQGPPPAATDLPHVPLVVGVLAIVAAVTIGVAEELIYRGYLQPRFEARLGRWPGMLVVALFFGLQHIGFALVSPAAIVAKVVATALAGVMFGLLYWWRKRLMPLVIAHVLLDIVGLGIPTLTLALA